MEATATPSPAPASYGQQVVQQAKALQARYGLNEWQYRVVRGMLAGHDLEKIAESFELSWTLEALHHLASLTFSRLGAKGMRQMKKGYRELQKAKKRQVYSQVAQKQGNGWIT